MRYRFRECAFDTERHELRRAGELVPMRPRVFGLLVHLIENRDRAIAKSELFQRLWPKRVVSDATLTACVKELRSAVGDSGDAQRIVQTIHGHGFRFVAGVQEDSIAPPAPPAARALSSKPAESPTEEYKHVSVLVCSLADSESHARRLGPESMHVLMQDFLATARRIVERFGGTVSEWTSDGFVALFGAPAALEDHGRRAVHSALQLQSMLATQTLPCQRGDAASMRARMGMDTGEILVGRLAADADRLFTAACETTRRAARLHQTAAPGEFLASETSYRLLESEICAQSVEPIDGAPVYRIDHITLQRGGVPHRAARTLSRFVGRERELALLSERLARAQSGMGQIVCVAGEPGIGKSRLLYEFRTLLSDAGALCWADAYCLAHHATTPYFPLVGLLRRLWGVTERDPSQMIAERLKSALRSAGITAEDAPALLIELLGVPIDAESLVDLPPGTRRVRTFVYLTQLLLRQGERRPCVIAIEDAHWIDATSEAFLEQLIARLASAPVLLIVTYRPGYRPPWTASSAFTQLALPRLTADESVTLIDSVPRKACLSQDQKRKVIASSQGNPFFLEEFAWTLAADAAGESERMSVPDTVQAVVAARIDQLDAAEKRLLQIAAVIGSPVEEVLLASVSECTPEALAASLSQLQSREFLYQTAAVPIAEFTFRHALTQEVAYRSLLVGTRKRYHRRIAEILDSDFPRTNGACDSDVCRPDPPPECRSACRTPEILARHWAEAEEPERSLACWRRAGQRASECSANAEAVANFRQALAMNARLAQSPERARTELELLLMVGPPLMARIGFSAPDVEAIYVRARELCREVGTPRQLFTATWGLWLHNQTRGRIATAKELVQQVLDLAEEVHASAYTLQAHHAAWTTSLTHGDLEQCRRHAQSGVRLYERSKHHSQAYLYGDHDPGLCAAGTLAITEWLRGRPDTALERSRETLELSRTLTHACSRLHPLIDMMWIRCFRREPDELREYALQAIALCTEHGFSSYLAVAKVRYGWALAHEDMDAGIAEMRANIDAYRALGMERHGAYFLTLLAQCEHRRGHIDDGLRTIEKARELIAVTAEERWLPEVHRLRGVLLLARSPTDTHTAEATLIAALDAARAQGTRSFELRAATDLARHWYGNGSRRRARELLEPVYGSFSEGLDLPDLREAHEVLANCS